MGFNIRTRSNLNANFGQIGGIRIYTTVTKQMIAFEKNLIWIRFLVFKTVRKTMVRLEIGARHRVL